MTPKQYFEFRKHYELVKEAKYLVIHCKAKKTADMIKLIAFKQKADMMPIDYIERYDHAWKD